MLRYDDSRSAARRVGLILEHLFGADAALPYRSIIGKNRAPALLRPGGADAGPIDASWRVVINALLEPEGASA